MAIPGSNLNPGESISLFSTAFMSLGKLFSWLKEKEKGNRQVVVCNDCGHWEKV